MKPNSFIKELFPWILLFPLVAPLAPRVRGQTVLTNGWNHDGAIAVAGQSNSWFFTANAGDSIVLRCGELSGTTRFGPMIQLLGPSGSQLSSNSHFSDAYLSYRTTNSGTFNVVVSSAVAGETGTYRLRFIQILGAFVVPPDDEGGPLINGANHQGTNSLGDEDIWTFNASASDNVLLEGGIVSGTPSYSPWLRLFGPDGAPQVSTSGGLGGMIEYQATNSGTFTVLVGSRIAGNSGSYRLGFARTPGAFVVPAGDEGGPLINGGYHTGTIPPGDIDFWTFNANAGDSVVLRCTATASGSWPRLRLYGPDGSLLADNFDLSLEALISLQLTNSGTFTVLVDSASTASMGPYALRFVKIPGPFVVPASDEGGALTNGAAYDGVIELGDEDIWTITASKGDTLAFRCLKTVGPSGFYTGQRLYGPDGKLLLNFIDNNLDNFFTYQTTNSGTFTLLVDAYFRGYTGSYRLRVAQIPRAFVVPPGDEGGVLTNGIGQNAFLERGDMDLWTFSANVGDSISVSVLNTTNAVFDARVQLYRPDGTLLRSGAGDTLITVSNTAPMLGTYTVLVTPSSPGAFGSYRVRLDKFPPDLSRALTLGTAVTNRFLTSGDRAYYVVNFPGNGHLRFTLDDLDNLGANEIYVRRGTPPSPGAYDYRFSSRGADQGLVVPNADAGDWYIVVVGATVTGTGDYTLRADLLTGLVLQNLLPNRIGNLTPATIVVEGAGFDNTAQAFLRLGASNVRTGAVSVVSGGRLLADFNLVGLSSNLYQLTIIQSGSSASLPLTVVNGGIPHLETQFIVPRGVGRHAPATLIVEYANTGDGPMPAPLLVVHGSDNALMTLDASLGAQGLWTATKPRGFSDTIQFLGSGATPGVLQPGERLRIPVYYSGLQRPWDELDHFVQFDLGVFDSENRSTVDWDSFKNNIRPDGISIEAWEVIWANFVAAAGRTWGDYAAMLAENATYFGKLGLNVTDVGELFAFEFAQADDLNPVSVLASVTDAALRQPGISLAFGRVYPQSISRHFRLGPLGRGWSHNWEFKLEISSDGVVTVLGPGGARRVFQPDLRGGFFNQPGDYGRVVKLSTGGYELRETLGAKIAFRSDGLLDYVEDLNGNRVTASYSGGVLTRLTHSAGQSLQLDYTGALLRSVTDSYGRMTTFGYDSAQHLTNAMYYGTNTVSYAYSIGQGVAREHALTSVTYPGGRQDEFTYDSSGRLKTLSRSCCAQQISFEHDTVGTVFVTDALTNRSKFFLEHHRLPAKVEDALGNTVHSTFDRNFNLTSIQGPDGRTFVLTPDASGNVTRVLNPLGQTISAAYTNNARLARITDARGQTTTCTYDAKGNSTDFVYPNGSRVTTGLNVQGEVLTVTNRRMQSVVLTRDAAGHVTRKVTPEGRTNDFAYDTRGNLTNVIDSLLGTTRLAYDDRDLLMALTYPDGKGFTFEYDAARRRLRRTSHDGYTLKYFYDSAGRLEHLEDGTGRQIIKYEYDPTGRLSRENKGNGTWASYDYDPAGQILHLINYATNGTVLSRFDYAYDANGNRTNMTTLTGTHNYTYDAVSRLTGVRYPNSRRVSYTYDAAGNRMTVNDNGTNVTYSANNLNQYTQVGSATFTFDADGNLTNRTDAMGTTSYEFNSENQLIRVLNPTEGTWQYTYDAFGNRVAVMHNGQTTQRLHDLIGLVDVVAEYDGFGLLAARYDHGLGLAERVAPDGSASYYNFDALGNAFELTGPSGMVMNRYDYEPFGLMTRREESTPNPFTVVGRHGVRSDRDGLIFMRARSYSPELGAFLSVDPMPFADSMANSYRYANGNPVAFIDPSGLEIQQIHTALTFNRAFGYLTLGYSIGEFIKYVAPYVAPYVLPETEAEHRQRINQTPCGQAYIKGTYLKLELYKAGRDWLENCRTFLASEGWENLPPLDPLPPGLPPVPAGDPPVPPTSEASSSTSNTVQSGDPNELVGPAGYGAANYLRGDGAFAYRINFENLTNATAPAQVVVITNTIPTNLDLATLEFLSVGFSDHFFAIPPGSQHYEHTESVSYNGTTFNVNIEAKVDTSTRQVQVKFESVMPDTGLPPTVDVGFLPPEDGTFRGDGHVAYFIRPQAGLPTGTEIRNIGFVTFDPLAGGTTFRTDLVDATNPNSGINTNRQALVTIDANGPASSVTMLPANSSSPNFAVMWAGTDVGAGISGYDVYVRTDASAWTRWQTNTPNTSALWQGSFGHTYGFVSVARDGAGNVESVPISTTAPDAQTIVLPQSNDRLQFVAISAQSLNLAFLGTAGAIWNMQRAPTLTGPWTNLGTFVIGTNGIGTFVDTNRPASAAYYRGLKQ